MRRPSAIEPSSVISDMSICDERNNPAHANNAILAAVGYNFRLLIGWLRILMRLVPMLLCAKQKSAAA